VGKLSIPPRTPAERIERSAQGTTDCLKNGSQRSGSRRSSKGDFASGGQRMDLGFIRGSESQCQEQQGEGGFVGKRDKVRGLYMQRGSLEEAGDRGKDNAQGRGPLVERNKKDKRRRSTTLRREQSPCSMKKHPQPRNKHGACKKKKKRNRDVTF